MNTRKIVVVGWDGRSNSIYRFYDELPLPAHERVIPAIEEIVEQFPNAMYCTNQFKMVPLKSFFPSDNG